MRVQNTAYLMYKISQKRTKTKIWIYYKYSTALISAAKESPLFKVTMPTSFQVVYEQNRTCFETAVNDNCHNFKALSNSQASSSLRTDLFL